MADYRQRVLPYPVMFCGNCHRPWADHLPIAREQLRAAGYRFFTSDNGIEYPTLTSTSVELAVTTATCAELAKSAA